MSVSLMVYIMHIFNNEFDKRQIISNIPMCHISMASLTTHTCHVQCVTVTTFSLSVTAYGHTPIAGETVRDCRMQLVFK